MSLVNEVSKFDVFLIVYFLPSPFFSTKSIQGRGLKEFKPFSTIVPLLNALKTENSWFTGVFSGYRSGT